MKAWEVLGYTYEADCHCTECAEKRFGSVLGNPDTKDSEGNPIHPIFASDNDWNEGCWCRDCDAQIIEPLDDCDENENADIDLTDLSEFDARQIASEWHGGQFTALYAFASSGHIDQDDLLSEIDSNLRKTNHDITARDLQRLQALRDWVSAVS